MEKIAKLSVWHLYKIRYNITKIFPIIIMNCRGDIVSTVTEKAKPEFSKKKFGVILIIGIVVATFLFNFSASSNIPDGFNKNFYEKAVGVFKSVEGNLWHDEGPLSQEQQEWIQKYILAAEQKDYNDKEERVATALNDYLLASTYIAGALENNLTVDQIDNEYTDAYEYAFSELTAALEIEQK